MQFKENIISNNEGNKYQETYLNLLFTSSWLQLQSTKLLKRYDISPEQFNILRILQSLHPKPATIKLLTAQMTDKMSNASRLVEKLKQKGLVERESCDDDRRRVNVSLTNKGLEMLEKTACLVEENIESNMRNLSIEQLAQLNELLQHLRS